MTVGDQNNNNMDYDFNMNSMYSNDCNQNNDQHVPVYQLLDRSNSESTSRMFHSASSNSLMSICTNSSCSLISTMCDVELFDGDGLKYIPAIPSEDVDEDWLQFGYLLDDGENVYFDNIAQEHHLHFHHHNHVGRKHNRKPLDDSGNSTFHRSYSMPLTTDVQSRQTAVLIDDVESVGECSDISIPSLYVEPPLTPPPSPLSSCASMTMPYFDEFTKEEPPTLCREKPFTDKQEMEAMNRAEQSDDSTLVMEGSNSKVKHQNYDEPIAMRTRRKESQSFSNDDNLVVAQKSKNNSMSAYCRMTPRPWWLDKLISMRRKNVCRSRKRKTSKSAKTAGKHAKVVVSQSKATKRQIPKNANVEDAFPLCDPRYISLGGNTVPFEEMPMKMELDLSGNAKITTQSELLNSSSNNNNENNATATGGGGEENDESDEDDDNASPRLKTPRIGNDESENDSTDYNSSADESAVFPSSASKFSTLSTTKSTAKMTAAERKRAAQAEKRRERELKKATKAVKAPKSRAVGQQQRRDRERRLQMIRKRNKTANGPARSPKDESPTKMARSNQPAIVTKRPTVRRSLHANNTSDGTKNGKGPAKYCPCGGSYDPKKVYVSCQKCSRWYHSKCAGLTEKRAQKAAIDPFAQWTCTDCDKSTSAELYCVCKRPYDDSRFYVGCDACEDWFHPECIGTTQAEVQKHDSFLCPKCQESDDI